LEHELEYQPSVTLLYTFPLLDNRSWFDSLNFQIVIHNNQFLQDNLPLFHIRVSAIVNKYLNNTGHFKIFNIIKALDQINIVK
jgi:hypothetical protein